MKKQLSIFYSIGTAALGIFIIVLFFAIQTNTINTYNENLPYISLGDNLKNKVTKGHLWFEEFMAGDESIQFEKNVLGLFQSSREILEAAINGDSTELGEFSTIEDEQIKKYLNRTILHLDNLIALTKKRKQFKDDLSVNMAKANSDSTVLISSTGEEAGGELDQAFDQAYDEVQDSLDSLILYINAEVNEDISFLENVTYVVILFILLIFGFSSFLVYRIQRKNETVADKGEKKLAEETNRINKMTQFVDHIIQGNYEENLDLNSEEDNLAQSLIRMKENLYTVNEDEKKRHWINEGIGKLNEITRKNHNKIEELYHQVVKFVVEYTNSNQGGLFILNKENNEAELVACYAYGRKKFLEKTIELGEGLIGQCLLEKEVIRLTDIPDQYISITSGLGEANPNALIIVPLKVNDEIYGALEMASFSPYEEHKLKLIETMSEVVASTVSSILVNEQTKFLLEQAQQQTEEMRAQEEEMRQNMEELSATQEELSRKESEYIETIRKLENQLQESNSELTAEQD